MHLLRWTKQAVEQLAELTPSVAERIQEKMDWYASQDDPLSFAKKLTHPTEVLFRFRIGDYRAICHISRGKMCILLVLTVKHRKDAYRG